MKSPSERRAAGVPQKGREVQKQRRAFLVGVSEGDEILLVQRKAMGVSKGGRRQSPPLAGAEITKKTLRVFAVMSE